MYVNTLITVDGGVFVADVEVSDFPLGTIVKCADNPSLVGTEVVSVSSRADEVFDNGWVTATT